MYKRQAFGASHTQHLHYKMTYVSAVDAERASLAAALLQTPLPLFLALVERRFAVSEAQRADLDNCPGPEALRALRDDYEVVRRCCPFFLRQVWTAQARNGEERTLPPLGTLRAEPGTNRHLLTRCELPAVQQQVEALRDAIEACLLRAWEKFGAGWRLCLLYTSPSPRD